MPCFATERAAVGPDASLVPAAAALKVAADVREDAFHVHAVIEAGSSSLPPCALCLDFALGVVRAAADTGRRSWWSRQCQGEGLSRIALTMASDRLVPLLFELMGGAMYTHQAPGFAGLGYRSYAPAHDLR